MELDLLRGFMSSYDIRVKEWTITSYEEGKILHTITFGTHTLSKHLHNKPITLQITTHPASAVTTGDDVE